MLFCKNIDYFVSFGKDKIMQKIRRNSVISADCRFMRLYGSHDEKIWTQ